LSIPLPKLSRVRRGRINGDPVGSEARRGKAASKRLSGRDIGSWTPTEQRTRERLMRQFIARKKGSGNGNTEAYRASQIWCTHPGCKKMNGSHTHS
jgi:hypothetical protein